MPKEAAKPTKQGASWSCRRRVFGQDLLVSGHRTSASAKKAMEDLVKPLEKRGKPRGLGPLKTTLAQALQDMALERLPLMKGAKQEARRINTYLRAADLLTLKVRERTPGSTVEPTVEPTAEETVPIGDPVAGQKGRQRTFFVVELDSRR